MKQANSKESAGLKLIYYYDALCGWCFGFSPVLDKIKEVYADKFDYEVISGGLFLNNRAGAVNVVAPHIRAGAYKSVETRTGVKFGQAFLADVFGEGKMILDSLPPTMALCIVKEQFPEQELTFAEMLLKAVYVDGMHPQDVDGLADLAATIGFDREEFTLKMSESEYQESAEKEFERFRNSSFSGMPALVIEKEGQQYPLSRGYVDFETLKEKLDFFIEQ